MLLGEEMRVCRKSDFNYIQMKNKIHFVTKCTFSLVYVHVSAERVL